MSYPYNQQGPYPPMPQGGDPRQYGYPPPPYGYSPPPHGYSSPPVSSAPALWSSMLFGLCALLCFVFAIPGFDGPKVSTGTRLAALIGQMFSEYTTRNIDFGVSVTITVGCTTALLAVLVGCRFGIARWILVGLSTVVALYYVYALVRMVDLDVPARFYPWIVVALMSWTSAAIVAALPVTGRAMRGYRPPATW